MQKKKSTGKAKAAGVAASQSKHRRKETASIPKPDADVNVTPPVEKPAAMPDRRQEVPMPSIPPAVPAPDNPVVLATKVIPPPPPAPDDPTLPAAMLIFYTMPAEVVHFQGVAILKTA